MASEVGSGQVAIFPVFKGFRAAVAKETDGAGDSAAKGFRRSLNGAGEKAGQSTGKGFRDAFEGSAAGFSAKATKALEADVAKAAKALSAARLKEQDAAGKARLAEVQLGEARSKYARDSSQVVRAEERMASAARTLQSAQDTTTSSTKNLKDAQGDLARAADRASDELSQSGTRGSARFGSNLVSGIKGLAGPIALAVGALGIGNLIGDAVSAGFGYLSDSVNLASGFEQSVGGVSAVFKDQAGQISEWAAAAAQGVGLSKAQYNDFATVVGSQFKNLGIPLDQVAGQTNGLIALGADLAAQYGGSTSQAVEALSSLLRGERDPIERYGVSINQAAVDAKLAEMGLAGLTGEAERQANAQATLALLTQQTADAQGAFGREAGTAAGQQARLQAELQNSQTALGTALLPTITTLTKLANEQLIPVLNKVIEEVGPVLSQALTDSAPAFSEMILAVAPLIPQLVKLAVEAIPPLLGLLIAISPLLIDWATNTGSIMTVLNSFFALLNGDTSLLKVGAQLQGLGGSVFDMATSFATFLSEAVTNVINFGTTVGTKIDEVVGFFTGLPQRAQDALGDLGGRLLESGKALVQGFIDGINEMFPGIDDAVGGLMEFVGGFFPNSPAQHGYFSGSGQGWKKLGQSGAAIEAQFSSGFGDGIDPFAGRAASSTGAGRVPAPASTATGVAQGGIVQNNYFDHMDPETGIEAANQRLAKVARRGGI